MSTRKECPTWAHLGSFAIKRNSCPGRRERKEKTKRRNGGEDIILKVPVGTVLHNLDANKKKEITKVGEKVLIAAGGFGGHGNYHFRSGKNTSPRQFQPGLPGETFTMRMELKLIADVGFIGYPNAGKTSLLNELTATQKQSGKLSLYDIRAEFGSLLRFGFSRYSRPY